MRGSTAVAVSTLAALALAGQAAAAASPSLPPVPPAWTPPLEVVSTAAPRGSWGLAVRVSTTAVVNVRVPSSFAQTPETEALFARWATFLGTLVHGHELGGVTLAFGLPEDVARMCFGGEAIACYSTLDEEINLPTTPPDGWPLEHVLAHEYGHHVAAARDNAPWTAFEWGTKRWATLVGVCSKVDADGGSGLLGEDWYADPGEAFAETYRLLNVDRASEAWTPGPGWLFGDAFAFNASTLRMVEIDVLYPWRPTRVGRVRGIATGRLPLRVHVSTPVDGTLRLQLRGAPRGTRLRLPRVADPAAPGFGSYAETIVCGERTAEVEVIAPRGGRFVLDAIS